MRQRMLTDVVSKLHLALFFCGVLLTFRASGTELKPATAQAFDEYAKQAEARMQGEIGDPNHFLYIDGLPDASKAAALARLRNGEVIIHTMTAHDGPVQVPGGLIHHWMATAFVPGVTADQVLQLWQDYSRYGELYKPDVLDAKTLSRDQEHFDVYYRFYRHAIVTVVYNAEFQVDYLIPEPSRNYSQAHSVRIAEVQNPDKPNEKEYPVGKDHGYMWRANFYSRCVERDGGVYVQIEFLALSRTVPAVFAVLVNPYMRSVPRDYLKRYMDATRTAVSSPDAVHRQALSQPDAKQKSGNAL